MQILYGKATASEAFQRYTFCKEFGWDYYTFMAQPTWFIEEISLIMNQVYQKDKQEADKAKRKVSVPSGIKK